MPRRKPALGAQRTCINGILRMWEYEKIDLNTVPPKADDIDVLDRAGRDGWELVAITRNNIAYLKRQVAAPKRATRSSAK